ncbi:acetylornithine aminotransferase [Collariella sp. IMI 366227]|nr:acetylornithine aminotransferase [Collariella sp. IMI 366227]
MAFRASLRLAAAARPAARRFYSQAATVPTSSASSVTGAQIHRDAALPNADPAEDSASAALVREHAPFMVATYARPPPVFVKGEGSYLYDIENRKYLDFTAGIAVNSLGHCDPEMSKLMAQQAKTLVHASNLYYNPWTGALSKLLIEKTLASGGMHDAAAVFICNSGSEANEAGIKFARKVGKVLDPSGTKTDIVSFRNAPFAPMVPGFRVGTLNDIAAIPSLVTPSTCSVLVEPIQGEGGVQPATDEFLLALAKRCREVGALLHYDEIQCGLSRTGSFWAHSEAHPDILTTAKALGNGFPIGATIVNANVAEKIKVGDHGTTFGGNPLACRLAHYIVERLAEPGLLQGVKEKGSWRRIREDREGGPGGLLVITAGTDTLRFVPSLVMSEAEIREGLGILEEAIKATRE